MVPNKAGERVYLKSLQYSAFPDDNAFSHDAVSHQMKSACTYAVNALKCQFKNLL